MPRYFDIFRTKRANQLRRNAACLFLAVFFTGCHTAQIKIEDVPILPEVEGRLTEVTVTARDINNKAEDEIGAYLAKKGYRSGKDVEYLLKSSATVEKIAAFYNEQLGKLGFERGANVPVDQENVTAMTWEKKEWLNNQLVVVAVIDAKSQLTNTSTKMIIVAPWVKS